MNDLKLGFVVNTVYGKHGHIPQQIHLLIVRILLYYCYTPKINVSLLKSDLYSFYIIHNWQLDVTPVMEMKDTDHSLGLR